jgi:protein-tyrosine phosphatase
VVERADAFVRGLEVVASAPGGVLFHCAAGKDRTGIFAAVLLEALGAEPDDIVSDYARTADVLDAIRLRVRPVAAALMTRAGSPGSGAALDAHPASMTALLEQLRGPRAVHTLAEAGLDDDLRGRLRDRLVERS